MGGVRARARRPCRARSRAGRPAHPEPATAVTKASFDSEAPADRARALAAARGLGLQPLAALRRGPPYELLGVSRGAIWRQLRDDRHNLAQLAAAPRLARSGEARQRARRAARGRGLRGRRSRRCARARGARSRRATSPSTCSFTRCTSSRSRARRRDLRRHRRRVPRAAPRRAEPARDRPPARPLAGARPGAVGRRPARARELRRRTGAMSARQGRLLLRRQITSSRAGSRRCATTARRRRTSASSPRKPRNFAANPALSSDGGEDRLRGLRAEAAGGAQARRDQRARARGRHRRAAQRLGPPGPPHAALGLQPDGLRGRAPRRLRVRRGQPQLRQALRPDPRLRQRPEDGPHEGDADAARARGRLAVGLQPRHLGRRAPRRLPGAAPRRPERGLRDRPALRPLDARQPRRALGARRRRRRLRPCDLRRRALRRVHDGRLEPRRRRPARAHAGLRPRPEGAHDDARQPGERRRGAVADDYSADAAVSRDGRYVAFSSAARNLGPRTAARASSSATCARAARGPSAARTASRSSRRSARTGGWWRTPRSQAGCRACSSATPRARPERLASRATGERGAAADRGSSDATISPDGRRVAFTSAATNLAAGKPDDRRGVFVRDLRAQTTALVSPPVPRAALAAAAAAEARWRRARRPRPRASWRSAARRCRARRSSRSSTTRSSAAATGRPCGCAPAAC